MVDFTFLKGDVMREQSGHVQLSEVSSHPRSLNETILALNQLADNDHPYNFHEHMQIYLQLKQQKRGLIHVKRLER